jgi:hypothetical protein
MSARDFEARCLAAVRSPAAVEVQPRDEGAEVRLGDVKIILGNEALGQLREALSRAQLEAQWRAARRGRP